MMNDDGDVRRYWVEILCRLARPVLSALAERRLRQLMPVEAQAAAARERARFTHLEALGRLLAGIAPWLEHGSSTGEEGRVRLALANLARRAIAAGTDPHSPDYMNFTEGRQPLVDAAFLSHAIVRAPEQLWRKLDEPVRRNLINALIAVRRHKPAYNNWLLFAAMVEAALFRAGEWWDPMRVDYAVRQHEQWHAGDGAYQDGPHFHWDYYNSFVIQPMLIDVLEVFAPGDVELARLRPAVLQRAKRYAAVQERMISPEGTFPPLGRSITYRMGAFQLLAQMALRRELPETVSPGQVRGALAAVIRRCMEPRGTFDHNGWLRIGLSGHQPALGEKYISTGSLYLCSTVLLPLGLSADDPFWADPSADWTAKKLWAGENLPPDHAL